MQGCLKCVFPVIKTRHRYLFSELPRHGNGAARRFLYRVGAPVAAGGGEVAAYAGHYAHPAAVDDA